MRGRPFDATVVFEVLKNPIAIGVTRRKGEERTGIAPALVDRRTWDAIQRLRRERRGRRGTPAERGLYLFTSRARHATCGQPLWGRRSARPDGVIDHRLLHSRPGCGTPFQRSEAVLEAEFVAWLRTWHLDADRRTRLAAFVRVKPAADDGARRRRVAEARLERARRLYLLGDLSDDDYATEKREARTVLDATAPAINATVGDVARYLAVVDAWPDMTRETRRAIIDALVTEIRFADDGMELVIRPELRRMIAAIAAPTVRTYLTATRDGKGRYAASRGVPSVDPVGFEPTTPRM